MAQRYATRYKDVGLQNGQTLAFKKGKGYYSKGLPTDPFATFNEPQINAHVKQIVGRLPAPQTDQQIQSQAQGMLDPVVAQITSAINARAQAGGQSIGGYTDQLAKNLMGARGQVDQAYAPAEQGTAATNAALADRLSGAGNATSDALASRLASIGSPDVTGQAAGAVRQAGTGSGNALYASGSASLEQLLGNHATAADYAGKLPDLARLGGLQQLGALQGRAQQDIRDQTAQVTSQLPSIVQGLRSQSDARANNRASVAADLYQFLTGQNTTRATAKAGLVGDAASLASQDARSAASIQAQNARTSATIQSQNARTQAQIDAANKRAALKVAADAKKAATKKKAGPTLTAGQVQTYKGTATTIAENAANGFTAVSKTPEYKSTTPGDPKGWSELNSDGKTYSNHHPSLGWSAAYDEMLKAGVPEALAKQALKRYYGDRDPATNSNVAGPPLPKRK